MSQTGSRGMQLSNEEEKLAKWDGSFTLTIGVNEKQKEDGESPTGPEQFGLTLLVEIAITRTHVNTGVQVD